MAPKRKKPTGDQEQAGSAKPGGNGRKSSLNLEETDPAKIVAKLEKSYKWLCKSDRNQTPGFDELLAQVVAFLDEAEDLEEEGRLKLAEDVSQKLQDCQKMGQMHQTFNDWCEGLSRWSTHQPVKQSNDDRLVPYDRQPPLKCGQKNSKPSLYMSLVPRPNELAYPPFVRLTPNCDPDWDLYFRQPQGIFLQRYFTSVYYHAKLFWNRKPGEVVDWETVPLFKSPGNPRAINYAEIENTTYENYMNRNWEELPKRPLLNKSGSAAEFEQFAVARGYRRAILERVLNEYEGWENNFISTPWRRVVHPEPIQKPAANHFKPLSMPRMYQKAHYGMKNRSTELEPSPWIYWYNQWFYQIKYLSGWSRQVYARSNWDEHKQIALPINYRGPFLFSDKCVYDEHWLKMGRYLVTLQRNLEKMSITRRRWLMQKIVEDIRQGERGGPLPDDLISRSTIDEVPDTGGKFRLVDEADVAWLKFLCHPSATKGLVGLSHGKPEDTLTILLDHRIQLLTNDALHNPFWVKDSSTNGQSQYVWRAEQIALEDLVPMLNLGGRDFFEVHWNNGVKTEVQRAARLSKGIKGVEPPNTLYQFTLKEAVKHCTKLAKMGRIEYKRPVDPKEIKDMWWSGCGNLYYYPDENWATAGGYVCPTTPGINPLTHDEVSQHIDPETNPARYPEERVRWRHPSEKALEHFNKGLRDMYAIEMMNRQRESAEPVVQWSKDAYRRGFLEEISWKLGPVFPEGTMENERDCPSWDDLVDYRTVITKDIGYSWRTINFFRMLAFRMGHTIRHCREVASQTSNKSALTRKHLYSALEEWERGTDDAHEGNRDILLKQWLVPFKASKPNTILSQINEKHKYVESDDMTAVFRTIRHGIIDDMVKNRTMLYPSRPRRYADDANGTTVQRFERDDVWSWASEPIRQRHAAYRRPLYFDMRRWPLNRQRKEVQARIAKRGDEDPTIQPVSAFYKYNLRVGPTALVPRYSDLIYSAITTLHDSDKERVARQLINRFSEQMVKMIDNAKDYDQHWQIEIVPPKKTVVSVKEKEAKQPLKLQCQSEFLPGRAIFPMGDTLRQQLKISHDIEQIIHPKPPSNLSSKIMGTISGLFKAPPERVALLPDIDVNRAPTSNPLKRKVPSSFASTPELPRKMQALMNPETNKPASPLRGPKLEATTAQNPPETNIFGKKLANVGSVPAFMDPNLKLKPEPTSQAPPNVFPTSAPRPDQQQPTPAGPHGGRSELPSRPEPEVPEQEKAGVEKEKEDDESWTAHLYPILGPTVPNGSKPTPLYPVLPTGREMAPPTISNESKQDEPKPPDPTQRRMSVHNGNGNTPAPPALPVVPTTPVAPIVPVAPVSVPEPETVQTGPFGGGRYPSAGTSQPPRPLSYDELKRLKKRRAQEEQEAYTRRLQRLSKLIEIRHDFSDVFPRGWRLVDTPGNDLECGLYAVRASVGAQAPAALRGEVPTLAELRRLIRSPDDPDLRAVNAALGLDNTGNLSADQVAAALLAWGRRRRVHLRLGVYRVGGGGGGGAPPPQRGGLPPGLDTEDIAKLEEREGEPQLIFCPVPDPEPDLPSYTIWIHSNETDDAARESRTLDFSQGQVLTVAEARKLEPATNHFSGMEPE